MQTENDIASVTAMRSFGMEFYAVHLTERFVKSTAPADDGSTPILRDDDVIGFGLQVRPSGRKSFTLDYTFEGRKRRLFIGEYPDWTVTAARDEAKRLKREVDLGRDPLAERDACRYAVGFSRRCRRQAGSGD